MFSYNLVENSIGFSYYLVENTLFTTDLAENRVLFTSATSFTPKRRALLSSSVGAGGQSEEIVSSPMEIQIDSSDEAE
jgi:hypothetical protein